MCLSEAESHHHVTGWTGRALAIDLALALAQVDTPVSAETSVDQPLRGGVDISNFLISEEIFEGGAHSVVLVVQVRRFTQLGPRY